MRDESVKANLALARGGDRRALDRLLETVHGRLRRLAEGRLGPGLRAKLRTSDVLQSTYLDVVKSVERFEGEDEEAFVGWVARIMENNIRDKGKYFQARKRRDPEGATLPLNEAEDVKTPGATPSVEVVRAEDLVLVSRALEDLGEDYRQVIILRLVEGRSHKEVGELLGRTEAATRMLLSRARAALALALDRLRNESG
ncbi:MAG: sigma-70 family RNA polymerase sigma factor [Planctomycetota bacterium]|nr:sigma-70 family RNA polymerase sigma factor [Planctomycetota bacterium]